jgi:hypothetical protein
MAWSWRVFSPKVDSSSAGLARRHLQHCSKLAGRRGRIGSPRMDENENRVSVIFVVQPLCAKLGYARGKIHFHPLFWTGQVVE